MELFADLVNSIWNAIGMESIFELFAYQVLSSSFFLMEKQIIRTHKVQAYTAYKSYELMNILVWFCIIWNWWINDSKDKKKFVFYSSIPYA